MKHIEYNKTIYGEPKFTPAETVAKLTAEKCFNANGKLMIHPEWFNAAEMFEALNAGLLKSKTYGRATYSHSDLFKA